MSTQSISKQSMKKKNCKFGNGCKYKNTTCIYYHREEEIQSKLDDSLSYKEKNSVRNYSKNFVKKQKHIICKEDDELSETLKKMEIKNEEETLEKTLEKTKLCAYHKVGCMNKENCTFAHSKQELRPQMCKFKTRYNCPVKNCTRYHEGDPFPTSDELYTEALKHTKVFNIPKEKTDEKFIVYLSSEDEDEDDDEIEKPPIEEKKTMDLKFEVDISLNDMIDLITYLNTKKIKILSFNSDFHN